MIDSVFEVFKQCACEIDAMLKNPSTKYLNSQNSSGDTQLEVDVLADKRIEKKLLALKCIKSVCSEEKQEIVYKDALKSAMRSNMEANTQSRANANVENYGTSTAQLSLDSIQLGKSHNSKKNIK